MRSKSRFIVLALGFFVAFALANPTTAVLAPDDYNGDGKPDLVLVNRATRQTQIFLMNGSVKQSSITGPKVPAGMTLVSMLDFNGDNIPDFLMTNANGNVVVGLRDGNGGMLLKLGPILPTGFKLVAAADENGDGVPDLILTNPSTGITRIYYIGGPIAYNLSPLSVTSGVLAPVTPSGYTLVSVVDMNRDGNPDFVFSKPGAGTIIWYMNGPKFLSLAVGPTGVNGYNVVSARDFNGDGKPDLVLYNPSTRATQFRFLNYSYAQVPGSTALKYTITQTGAATGPTISAGYDLVAP